MNTPPNKKRGTQEYPVCRRNGCLANPRQATRVCADEACIVLPVRGDQPQDRQQARNSNTHRRKLPPTLGDQ